MVETLTESFCERCGTRYEFRAPTRLNPLRKTRGLFGGLKNYLTSQDALSDAIGDAMRSEEDQLAAAQLEAFHETFNFCIGCRQYTCLNCWNDGAGRCRTCAPIAGTDDLADRLAAVRAGMPLADAPPAAMPEAEPVLERDELTRRLGIGDWPSGEPAAPQAANGTGYPWPETDDLVAPQQPAAWSGGDPLPEFAEPEPVAAEVEPVEPEPEPVAAEVEPADREPESIDAEPVTAEAQPVVPEPEPELAGVEPPVEEPAPVAPLRVVAWEDDASWTAEEPRAVEAPTEPELVDEEPIEATPVEPVAAAVEPEPQPDAEAEPEPEIQMPRVAPIRETILRFPTQPPAAPTSEEPVAAQADTPELAARRAQLDLLGLGDPGEGPVDRQPAVLPYRSRGAAPTPAEIAMHASGTGFWEASAREVAGAAAHVGVQNCGGCGLSLSATARFCRRCGTRQARSA